MWIYFDKDVPAEWRAAESAASAQVFHISQRRLVPEITVKSPSVIFTLVGKQDLYQSIKNGATIIEGHAFSWVV